MKHARADYDRIQDPAGLIPDDEPVFLIRGKDLCAPRTVRAWASVAHELGASDEIIKAALDQAKRMEAWQTLYESKVPDMPKATA
jgi:hypothetical protein